MKLLVAIKKTLDVTSKIRLTPTGNVDVRGAKLGINPFCQVAHEAAVRLKEKRQEKSSPATILTVTCGPPDHQDILRQALALGSDAVVRVDAGHHDGEVLSPLLISQLLHAVALRETPDVILCGKQATDTEFGQTSSMLAGLLSWSHLDGVVSLSPSQDETTIEGVIRTSNGTITIEAELPAVISCDLSLNTPRVLSLSKLLKVKSAPIPTLRPQDLGVTLPNGTVRVNRLTEAQKVRQQRMVQSVDDLMAQLFVCAT